MVAVRIPGADSIESVAPARDPGVRADASDFGADIGASMEHFGNAAVSLGAHLYQKRQAAQDDVYSSTYDVNASPALTQTVLDTKKQFPDGGPGFMEALQQNLDKAHQDVTSKLASQGLQPSDNAMATVNKRFNALKTDYLVKGVVIANNEKVAGLQTQLGDNVDAVKSGVLAGTTSLDDGLKAVEIQAASGKGLYSASQLVEQKDKWQQGVIDAAIESKTKAGDLAGAQAIKDKYYGKTPTATVKDSLPGGIGSAVDAAAFEAGLDPRLARRIVQIESSGNPSATTGKYKGLFQLSDEGFAAHGGKGDIFDPGENIKAGIHSLKADFDAFKSKYGRDPTATELYLSHQQGQGGLDAQLSKPDAPAWQNMASTAEGRQKGQAWAKMAIWGNIPDQDKEKFGSVENVTGKQFVDLWRGKVEGGGSSSGGKVRLASSDGTIIPGATKPNDDASGDTADASSGDNAPVLPNVDKSLYWDKQFHAAGVDQKQAQERQQAQIKAASDSRELEVFKDIHSDTPTLTGRDILNDTRLTKEAKEKLFGVKMTATGGEKADKTYGPGFYKLYQQVHATDNDPNRITDPTSLYSHVGPDGDLTVAGVDKLVSEIQGRKTPEGVAEGEMKSQFFKMAKSQISGSDEGLHIHDPKGDELYLKFMAQALPAYDAGRKAGKSATQLLNPDSPDYVGKSIATFKRPMDQWFSDVVQSGGPKTEPAQSFDPNKVNSLDDLVTAYRAGKVPKAVADQLAVDKGWAVKRAPAAAVAVPVSQ